MRLHEVTPPHGVLLRAHGVVGLLGESLHRVDADEEHAHPGEHHERVGAVPHADERETGRGREHHDARVAAERPARDAAPVALPARRRRSGRRRSTTGRLRGSSCASSRCSTITERMSCSVAANRSSPRRWARRRSASSDTPPATASAARRGRRRAPAPSTASGDVVSGSSGDPPELRGRGRRGGPGRDVDHRPDHARCAITFAARMRRRVPEATSAPPTRQRGEHPERGAGGDPLHPVPAQPAEATLPATRPRWRGSSPRRATGGRRRRAAPRLRGTGASSSTSRRPVRGRAVRPRARAQAERRPAPRHRGRATAAPCWRRRRSVPPPVGCRPTPRWRRTARPRRG